MPSNDKKRARINCISHILGSIPYKRVEFEEPKLGKRQKRPNDYVDGPDRAQHGTISRSRVISAIGRVRPPDLFHSSLTPSRAAPSSGRIPRRPESRREVDDHRLELVALRLGGGLDSLVVFGVAKSLSVPQTANQLANLLDAHHYTDGLAFVRPGTPTNNTDDRRTDYSSNDPGHERSFAIEVAGTPTLDDNNALRVGTALGLRFERILPTFGRIDRGLERDNLNVRSMNTALWQVGWGYFLSNMIGKEAGLTQADIDWARRHFFDHVRSFGPFPTLRCGAQPYGILPVTSLDLWQLGTGEPVTSQDTWLKDMLITLRDNVWRTVARSVARIGNRQNLPDPDADLADLMRTEGVSTSYRTRNVFGRHFLQHLFRFLASSVMDSNPAHSMPDSDPAQTALLRQLGISSRPRLTHLWNADRQWSVAGPARPIR